MNRLKRFLALALVLTTLIPIAACGDDKTNKLDQQVKPNEDDQTQTDPQKVTAQIVLSQKEVTIGVGKTFSLAGAYI